MMLTDAKKKAGMVLALDADMKPKRSNELGDEIDASAGMTAAAEELLAAIKANDIGLLKSALKSMVSMCMDDCEAEDSEMED